MVSRSLICAVVALLLTPGAAGVLDAQGLMQGHIVGHPGGPTSIRGPLPDAVRRATERYRDVRNAVADGYVQFQGCVSGSERGAMGVHYSKFPLFDGVIDVTTPEVLVYEPMHGRLHLVAAEYVIPAALWDPVHEPFDKPQLMGHLLQFIPGPNRYGPDAIYELHVWAWKANRSGPFADFNPDVSCIQWGPVP